MSLLTPFGISQNSKSAWRNPWVLGMLALIVSVIAVNAGFILMAIKSNPGLVDNKYYDHGRNYEQNILKQNAARNSLGLEAKFETPEHITIKQPGVFRFSAIDKHGLPFAKAEVSVTAYRPSDAAADFVVQMHNIADGLYQADISFPLKGTWDLIVKVKRGEDNAELTRRISVHQT